MLTDKFLTAHIYAAFKDWRVRRASNGHEPTPLTLGSDLRGRCLVLWGQLCPCVYICILAHYHHHIRIQLVRTYSSPCAILKFLALVANARAQLLTVPPYAVSAVYLCLNSYVSDRLQSRGIFVAAASALAGIGYVYVTLICTLATTRLTSLAYNTGCCSQWPRTIMSATLRRSASRAGPTQRSGSSSPGVRSILCSVETRHLILISPDPTVAHNLGSETKKATGIPMYMAIGQCGSVLGSHIYPKTDGPRYM